MGEQYRGKMQFLQDVCASWIWQEEQGCASLDVDTAVRETGGRCMIAVEVGAIEWKSASAEGRTSRSSGHGA